MINNGCRHFYDLMTSIQVTIMICKLANEDYQVDHLLTYLEISYYFSLKNSSIVFLFYQKLMVIKFFNYYYYHEWGCCQLALYFSQNLTIIHGVINSGHAVSIFSSIIKIATSFQVSQFPQINIFLFNYFQRKSEWIPKNYQRCTKSFFFSFFNFYCLIYYFQQLNMKCPLGLFIEY